MGVSYRFPTFLVFNTLMPQDMQQELTRLCEQVQAARDNNTPLSIIGGNTKAFYGEPNPPGETLDMSNYRGILSYEPSELVITARAGTRVQEIEATLAEKGQMLAFEPPRFGAEGTLGGAIASGLSGPRRMAVGSTSDFVLGARLLDSKGNLMAFGGEVMKNVAGYDVSRLLTGSMGSLGPIVELSVKVLPLPEYECTHELALDLPTALATMNDWRAQPLPISATAWVRTEAGQKAGILRVRLSGSQAAVNAAESVIGGEVLEAAPAKEFWDSLRDQKHAVFAQRPLWRLSVPPTTPDLALGESLVEWNGGLRWVASDLPAAALRQTAQDAGGHATLYRYDNLPAETTVFHPLSAVIDTINQRLMEQLDPAGIFRPGRLLPAV